MMLKYLRNKGTSFKPGTETFPDVNVDALASGLSLEKRGTADGKLNIPASDAEPFTRAEQEALDRVRSVRKRGLDHYENQISAYESRIRGARAEREEIELRAGQVRATMAVASDKWRNLLTNERRSLTGFQEKLDAYRTAHGIKGPPRMRKNPWLMWGTLLLVMLFEVALSGFLFAQKNVMGLVGGMGVALVISLVNIGFSLLLGLGSRYLNLRSSLAKLLGGFAVLFFLVFTLSLNLTVSHFRDALEILPWDQAAFAAIANLKTELLGVKSFNSWIIFFFGVFVSLIAFIEGLFWFDRHPGYNQVYEDTEEAIDVYSESYEEAQDDLEKIFMQSRDELRAQAQSLRARIRSALDAVGAQSTLTRQLMTFLASCNSAAYQLLTRYREANLRARDTSRPAYFSSGFEFERYEFPPGLDALQREEAQKEIAKIDAIVETGVADILHAREKAISAFPTVGDLLNELRRPPAPRDAPAWEEPAFSPNPAPEQR